MFVLLYSENSGRILNDPVKLINPGDDTDTYMILANRLHKIQDIKKERIVYLKFHELSNGIFHVQFLDYKKESGGGYGSCKFMQVDKSCRFQMSDEFDAENYECRLKCGIMDIEEFNATFFRFGLNRKEYTFSTGERGTEISLIIKRVFYKISNL